MLDGLTGRSWYHAYPVADFVASSEVFDVRVGGSHFTPSGVILAVPQLRGRVDFTTPLQPWPVTWRSPGIMGWYGLVPFMECYHGIVSFGHGLSGDVQVEGATASFEGGRGYLEKDWGRAFPSGYVWMQTNHIDSDPTASLIASVAIIPWLRNSFRGFVIGLLHHGRLHQWATHNRSNEVLLSIDDQHVRWTLDGPDGRLELIAARVRPGLDPARGSERPARPRGGGDLRRDGGVRRHRPPPCRQGAVGEGTVNHRGHVPSGDTGRTT